jgi:hypothetical protein
MPGRRARFKMTQRMGISGKRIGARSALAARALRSLFAVQIHAVKATCDAFGRLCDVDAVEPDTTSARPGWCQAAPIAE